MLIKDKAEQRHHIVAKSAIVRSELKENICHKTQDILQLTLLHSEWPEPF